MNTSESVPWWPVSEPGGRFAVRVDEVLLPLPGAARHARNVVTQACLQWQMPYLLARACVVVTELVTNAAVHARTLADLRLIRSRRHLIIVVHDGSRILPPKPARQPDAAPGHRIGSGLTLVAAMADCWGCRHVDGGKVVWAALRHDAVDRYAGVATTEP
ncbi:ATP-binding protein [Actinoplanes sp. URMC 104]|uniref:ATP-binding protein n=1 Tax=Actinoplanes sp. URMC 104 TaxID=3423409 RepID=UPI003F1BEAA7